MKSWMSENSKEHYCGIPNKDECMELAGRVSFGIVVGIVVIALLFL